jgi:glucose/arabinose dehydrogenase
LHKLVTVAPFLLALGCSDSLATDRPARIELTASSPRVEVGRTVRLSATTLGQGGSALQGSRFTWSVSDSLVARVDADGVVSGVSAGVATVRASSEGLVAGVEITVIPRAIARMVVVPDSIALLPGGSRTLRADALDADGGPVTGRTPGWSSSDPSVAVVSADGTVLGVAPGRATVTAELDGSRASATVTIAAPALPTLALEEVASGIKATYLTAPTGDSRLFLVGVKGQIWIVQDGRVLPEPFLDLSSVVNQEGEHGLYSIAFHPRFATNGFVYVTYADREMNNRIERYTVSADRQKADPASARLILRIDHPIPHDHYGGWIGFAPDGKLLVSVGDGGPGNSARAEDRGSQLGKILRLDVDSGDPYAVPADNPFQGTPGARPEIWATGLRNPWRASVDRATGLLYVADVGEDDWEEVDVSSSSLGGLDYGWNRMEGSSCFPAAAACGGAGTVSPALEYTQAGRPAAAGSAHPTGCSVIGGYVYRGARMPALRGEYFYADFCMGWVRSFHYDHGTASGDRPWFSQVGSIVSFGEGGDGELYVLTYPGRVFRIVPAAGS